MKIPPPHSSYPRAYSAFTLIELSIILVIIGLIAGGIVVGQELIEASRNRKYVSTSQSLIAKVRLFKDMYKQLPGDTDKMWNIYGTQCAATLSSCTGNNTGIIHTNELNGGGFGAQESGGLGECGCVFRHLYLAGFWETEAPVGMCGLRITQDNLAIYPDAIPKAKEDAYYYIAGKFIYGQLLNAVSITTYSAGWGGSLMRDGKISGPNARAIEDKFDDASPTTGKLLISNTIGHQCLTGTASADPATVTWHANYRTANEGCNLHFLLDN